MLLCLASAHRDPLRYPDPDRFDIGRQDKAHLALGHGLHYCLGAPLARLQIRVALEVIDRQPARACPLRTSGEALLEAHLPITRAQAATHHPEAWFLTDRFRPGSLPIASDGCARSDGPALRERDLGRTAQDGHQMTQGGSRGETSWSVTAACCLLWPKASASRSGASSDAVPSLERRRCARRDRVSDHGEPVHQQLHPLCRVLRQQPSRPGQRREAVQGRPEHLGELPPVDAVPPTSPRFSISAAKASFSGAGVSSCAYARPPSSWNKASRPPGCARRSSSR
ncbi:hypothetical protein STANM309S_06440 [Streptomyces tanashiensis]